MKRILAGLIALGWIGCRSATQTPSAPLLENKVSAGQAGGGPGCVNATEPTPAPPQGTILPRVGCPQKIRYWGKPGVSTWEAHYHVDPTDPRIRSHLASTHIDGPPPDLGDAGLELYREQVRSAGVEINSDEGTQFTYPIQGGALTVTVLSDGRTDPDPADFVLYVDVPGG